MGIKCTVCKSDKFIVLEDAALGIYRCGACSHYFTVPDEKNTVGYEDHYYSTDHANWFRHPNYGLFRFIHFGIKAFFGEKKIRLLDVGCGKGDFLKFMRKKSPEALLYGIDLSDNRCPDINFIKGDFLKEDFRMRFDAVISLAAIEHVTDIASFAGKLNAMLLPGGLAVIMTVNAGGVFYTAARILKKMGWNTPYRRLHEPAHLEHFTDRSLAELMRRNGFEIVGRKNHNYPVSAIDLPRSNRLTKAIYLLGAVILFSMPPAYGILQTVFCRKAASKAPDRTLS